MATYYSSWGWGGFYTVIQQWQEFGVFTILLPMVLIFAVVFAILEKINLFDNRGVHIIIALVLGFFSVSNPYVSGIFLPLFSNLGLGIAILLVLLILLGLVLKTDEEGFLSGSFVWVLGIVGVIIFLVVLGKTGIFELVLGSNFKYWLRDNAAWLILFVVIAILIIGVIGNFGKKDEDDYQLVKKKKR